MAKLLLFVVGIVIGVAAAGGAVMLFGAGVMLQEAASPVDFDATVKRLTTAAEKEGWKVLGVTRIDKSVEKHGAGKILPVAVISLCHPEHAAKVMGEDETRRVSVMMPCRISVYEKADGKAYVGSMNAGLVGRLFGGVVTEVMSGPVTEAQDRFIEAALAEGK